MASFHSKDLANMPIPEIIKPINYDDLLQQRKDDLNANHPLLFDENNQPIVLPAELITTEAGEKYWKVPVDNNVGLYFVDLDSDPLARLLQADTYREMLLRYQFNQFALGLMPAYATGDALDHLASRDNVTRLIISEEDNTATPPIAAVYEDDETLRRRWLFHRESSAVGGSPGWYLSNALNADALVKDATAISPNPRGVLITILSHEGNGEASTSLIEKVDEFLNNQYTAVQTDEITVQSAQVIEYELNPIITYNVSANIELVNEKIWAAYLKHKKETEKIGHEIIDSAVKAFLHQDGVYKVELNDDLPLINTEEKSAFCTALNITRAD